MDVRFCGLLVGALEGGWPGPGALGTGRRDVGPDRRTGRDEKGRAGRRYSSATSVVAPVSSVTRSVVPSSSAAVAVAVPPAFSSPAIT